MLAFFKNIDLRDQTEFFNMSRANCLLPRDFLTKINLQKVSKRKNATFKCLKILNFLAARDSYKKYILVGFKGRPSAGFNCQNSTFSSWCDLSLQNYTFNRF